MGHRLVRERKDKVRERRRMPGRHSKELRGRERRRENMWWLRTQKRATAVVKCSNRVGR